MFIISLNKRRFFLVAFWLGTYPLMAQRIGQIVNNSNRPIPFATILSKNNQGVVSDENGYFEFTETFEKNGFSVSALGYKSKQFYLSETDTLPKFKLEEETKELETFVVTGNYEPQSAKNSVYQVRTIDRASIQNRASTSVQEVLNTQLGIRFSQDNALGSSNLELLGLSGQNVKILIDGVPMIGRQGTSNEININQIDVNRIEKIEIIEGPMSVVYGADALAGVINIITKKGADKNLHLQARIQEESVGSEYQPFAKKGIHNRSISGNYGSGNWNFGASISQNNFGGWKGEKTGRDYEWLPKDQNFLNLQTAWSGKSLNLDYQLDFLNETVYSYGADARLEIIDQEYITNRWMHRLNGRWETSKNFGLNWQSAFTNYSRDTETWVTNVYSGEKYLSQAEGANSSLTYSGFTWRMMADWQLGDQLKINPGLDINLEKGEGERIDANEGIQDYALFLSANWNPTESISLRPGLRKTWNSSYEAPPLIPSINTKWSITEQIDFRLAYARGFRAPSIRELYFNFFDASHSIQGNPDLIAETSHSLNGSLDWKKQISEDTQLKTVIGGFYNDISNRIAYAQDPENIQVTTLINVDRYKTTGATWNETLILKNWNFNLGFSYIGRFNQLSEEENTLPSFVWTPEITSSISYQIKPWKTTANLFYKWTGSLPGYENTTDENGNTSIQEVSLDGYQWMDLTLKKELWNSLTLNLGIKNLFDVKQINSSSDNGSAHSSGSQRPIGYGRSYFLGITYQFNN